jgi:hypothetical protein
MKHLENVNVKSSMVLKFMSNKHGSKKRTSVTEFRKGTSDILCIMSWIFELQKI